jgi:uncharacterized protein YjbJ (UPF0337 family)
MDDRTEGKVKEVEGKLTGDKDREAEGKAQDALGHAKDAAESAADAARAKLDDITHCPETVAPDGVRHRFEMLTTSSRNRRQPEPW